MITVSNITVRFSDTPLFQGVTFVVGDRDRIGLVGHNGAGKSTLLKVISGYMASETGQIIIPHGQCSGYLAQEMKHVLTENVFDETMKAFEGIIGLEKEVERLTEQLTIRTDYESDAYLKLIQDIEDTNHRLQMLGNASKEGEAERVLLGLGFDRSDFTRSMTEFSGGWRMRVELAKILLQKPDMLLLDEPTNHLDIESIQWFEDYLTRFEGAVLLVSHDRAFLDNVTTRTIEISNGKIYDYKASYSDYVELQQERIDHQQALLTNQQRQIADTMKFIDRFRYKSTKSRQVQSKLKMIDKMDKVDVDGLDKSAIDFFFPPAPHAGKIIIEAEGVSKRYDTKLILNNLDFIIDNGDKIAFVGKNGEGKTTMSRMIIGQLEYEGKLKLGHQVKIGYYAQNQDELLDPDQTVLDVIDRAAVGEIRKKIRNILGAFLFGEEDVHKKVKVLSGGEKSRLSLARLLLEPVNLLVLDEPTNHLDMRSKDVLKSALMNYDGTLIVVSHDRDFLQGLTNKVFEFKNKQIKHHIGDIVTFLEYRQIENLKSLEEIEQRKASNQGEGSKNKNDYEEKKVLDREIRRVKNAIQQCEKDIEDRESKIKKMDDVFANPPENADISKLYIDYDKIKQELQTKMDLWETLVMELEEVEKLRF